MAIVFYLNNGKTNAIVRNALIDFKFVTNGTANLKMCIRGFVLDFQNSSQGFYDTGKHLLLISLLIGKCTFKTLDEWVIRIQKNIMIIMSPHNVRSLC